LGYLRASSSPAPRKRSHIQETLNLVLITLQRLKAVANLVFVDLGHLCLVSGRSLPTLQHYPGASSLSNPTLQPFKVLSSLIIMMMVYLHMILYLALQGLMFLMSIPLVLLILESLQVISGSVFVTLHHVQVFSNPL
jgi:hypothetical protein